MPCFGSRKKAKRKQQRQQEQQQQEQQQQEQSEVYRRPTTAPSELDVPNMAAPTEAAGLDGRSLRAGSAKSTNSAAVAQIRQEYNELKSKQTEHLDVISRQSAELKELRDMLAQQKQTEHEESHKDKLLEEREQEIRKLMDQMNEMAAEGLELQLAEKEQMLLDKDKELEELNKKWAQADQVVRPALQQVTEQLEDLKKANQEAVNRLADKEKELATLRAQVNRRDRKKNDGKDEERQKRLNRLTMDLENDRIMIQKLEELNQQLEAQKQEHEAILQSHAEEMAEKDRELVQHQKSLSQLKQSQERALQALERKQAETIQTLKMQHQSDTEKLRERLEHAEKRAKSEMNDEVEKLLQEFEQSEHAHSVELANLAQSHREQVTKMRQGQKAELRNHMKRASMILEDAQVPDLPSAKVMPLRKSTGGVNKSIRWPVAALQQNAIELNPRDPGCVQVYVSGVSGNATIKRNQESLRTLLESNQIPFQVVDVAKSEPALQHMRRQPNSTGRMLPQVFVGGTYRGQYEDALQHAEEGRLEQFLRPSGDSPTTPAPRRTLRKSDAQRSTASLSSNEPMTPTSTHASVPAVPPIRRKSYALDEDAELLKELEKELAQQPSQAHTLQSF